MLWAYAKLVTKRAFSVLCAYQTTQHKDLKVSVRLIHN